MKQKWKRIGSLILSVCMVFTLLPTMAFAETDAMDSSTTLGVSGTITTFAELDTAVSTQSVEVGTTKENLVLPDELMVTVVTDSTATATDSDASKETQTTVTVDGWTADPEYDGNAEGVYTFTPTLELSDGVTVTEGVYAPQITVMVEEKTALTYLHSSTNYMPSESAITGLNKGITTSFTFEPQNSGTLPTGLPVPSIPRWEWQSDGSLKVSWNPVANASSYQVKIYKNEAVPLVVEPINDTELLIDPPIGAGSYTFTVAAVGDGIIYVNSPHSPKSDVLVVTSTGTVTGTMDIGSETGKDLSSDQSGSGWAWTASSATLTLTGDITGDIKFNGTGDITIAVNGTHSVTGRIICNAGLLTLNGGGTLTVNSGTATFPAVTIRAYNGLTIDNVTVNATTTDSMGRCIYINSGDFTMTSGTLNANGIQTGLQVGSGDINISGTANVTATISGGTFAIITNTRITIGGNAVVTGNGNSGTGIQAEDGIIINGGAVTAKGQGVSIGGKNCGAISGSTGGITVTGGTLTVGDVSADPGNGNVGSDLAVSGVAPSVTVNGNITNSGNLTVSSGNVTITGTVSGTTKHTGGTLNGSTPPTTYTATLSINLDGSPFTSQFGSYTLKLDGDESTTVAMTGTGATRTANVSNGTWKVYEGSSYYTGVTITVNNAPTNATLEYYSGTHSVNTQGTASGGTISLSVVSLGGDDFDNITSGSKFLKGDKATFTATGVGAESYTYVWSGTHGTETISGTGSTYTINSVQGKVDITCIITGSGTTGGGATPTITVKKHPQNVTVTQGVISGILTTEAVASNGNPVKYQWLRHIGGIGSDNTEIMVGETNNTLTIPTNLTSGTYRYICSYTAEGCGTVDGNAATVTVNPPFDNGGNGGGTGSGGSSGGSSGSTPTTTPGKTPNQPITASAPVTATAGTGGTANAAITDKIITDAIAKVQADAKAQDKTANGTSVALNITMPKGATSLTTTLTRTSLNSLVNAGVTNFKINGALVSLEFDLAALKEIQKQSTGNITISIAPATELSKKAKALISNRPVYNIIISTVKDGKTTNITSLGNGTATLSIPYTPGKNEAVGYLFGVYVNAKGNATRIAGSAYDANTGCMIFTTTHFSLYGIGYTAPSAKFTDIGNHWGRDAINYIVGRGLLSGASDTTFAPNTAMTRGMLVTALGRLAEMDVKTYTANSFTDVKAESTFRPYIEWAYSRGVVQGIGNQQFAPNRAITREEIAVIFANYAKATGYKLPVTREATTYGDASSIDSVYKTAVTAMQQAGIMMGGKDNKFNPKSSATRAEVSSMLHRYIKLTINPDTAQGWALNDAGQYLYYKDGLMVSGKWLEIDGKWYYFNADGSLAKNTKIDGYEVDENGVRKTK